MSCVTTMHATCHRTASVGGCRVVSSAPLCYCRTSPTRRAPCGREYKFFRNSRFLVDRCVTERVAACSARCTTRGWLGNVAHRPYLTPRRHRFHSSNHACSTVLHGNSNPTCLSEYTRTGKFIAKEGTSGAEHFHSYLHHRTDSSVVASMSPPRCAPHCAGCVGVVARTLGGDRCVPS